MKKPFATFIMGVCLALGFIAVTACAEGYDAGIDTNPNNAKIWSARTNRPTR